MKKTEFDNMNEKMAKLLQQHADQKNDSLDKEKSYKKLQEQWTADSIQSTKALAPVNAELARKNAAQTLLEQQAQQVTTQLQQDQKEIARIRMDSNARAKEIEEKDKTLASANKQLLDKGPIQQQKKELEQKITLHRQKNEELAGLKKQKEAQLPDLTAKSQKIATSLATLNASLADAARAKSNSDQLSNSLLTDFNKDVTAVTSETSFSTKSVGDLKTRGERLATYFRDNETFKKAMGRLDQYASLSAAIQKSQTILQQPYTTETCNAALDQLKKETPLTPEQKVITDKYRIALEGYCKVNTDCYNKATKAKEYIPDARVVAAGLFSDLLQRVDRSNYPFLYNEVQRLLDNNEKKLPFDSKIPKTTCQ
ncbi:MAG: hypothetical protein JST68_27220 [Bacteroidetes bacterium]|nr:hypothetical protein [Bacteroidota bacterium]